MGSLRHAYRLYSSVLIAGNNFGMDLAMHFVEKIDLVSNVFFSLKYNL